MLQKYKILILKVLIIVAVLFAYQNSFDNAFHFDDSHTILDNPYVRDISNLGMFFTDGAKTFSSLPTNQVYRPVVTSVLAIDYWLAEAIYGNGYDVRIYHFTIMLAYIVLLLLLYYFFKTIFDKANPHPWNAFLALFATAFYGLHTVNAETVNYIISSSDLYSTLAVVASFVIFMKYPAKRNYGLFLLPFAVGMLVKLTTAMFIPMVMVYYFLFEYLPLQKAKQKVAMKSMLKGGAILLAIMVVFTLWVMHMASDTFVPSDLSRWSYIITMPAVLLHYVISFFYPYNLSADTDWQVLDGIWHLWFFAGMAFLAAMGFLFFKTFRNIKYAPIAFGIAWFYIALAPTSSLIPLAEVLNDHRMFFPFVGLMLLIVYSVGLLIIKNEKIIRANKQFQMGIYAAIALVLLAHTYGTRQRTQVWDTGYSLWYNVTIQSPNNARGLMNYGLLLMSDSKYDQAMEYYNKALVLGPKYPYLHTNMAICYNAMGDVKQAEYHFARAIEYGYYNYKTHYYYARFLTSHKRYDEAIVQLLGSLKSNPQFIYSMQELMNIYIETNNWKELEKIANKSLSLYPKDSYSNYSLEIAKGKMTKLQMALKLALKEPCEDNFIELSLNYYYAQQYDSSAWAAQQALIYNEQSPLAYNNICAAFNRIGRFDEAAIAGSKAVKIDSKNQLAKNNLAESLKNQALELQISKLSSFDDLINLSLDYYGKKMYYSCIKACQKSLDYNGDKSLAYNNICSAYNALHKYKQAIIAGQKAVKANDKNELAKNNLAYAKRMLSE